MQRIIAAPRNVHPPLVGVKRQRGRAGSCGCAPLIPGLAIKLSHVYISASITAALRCTVIV